MNGPGFFAAVRIVAAKDLRLEWRTWETLSSTLVFSLIVLVVFIFAFDEATLRELGAARLLPGMIWTVVAFAAVVGVLRSFQLERPHGTLDALFLAPVDRGAVFAGKMLANLVHLMLLQAALLPLAAVLFGQDLTAAFLPLVGVLLLHGLGLAELGTLFAAVTSRVGRGEALLATLLLPAAAPLLISAVKCTAASLAGQPLATVSHWVLMSAGFDALYLWVGLATFEFVLED